VAVALVSSTASAFEREWHAGAHAGVAALSGSALGPSASLHGAYGLNDLFDVAVELGGSRHGFSGGTDVLHASVGAIYKIDILQWIPYVGAYGGYYHWLGAPGPSSEHGPQPGASVQLGIDYLLARELALGMDLRWHASFHDGLTVPLFSAGLGAEYRWGW
jgi:hypothetical protein